MTAISFEFYPPKTDDQRAQLDRTASKLKVFAPEYVSCTFGAGGSTLSYTSETVRPSITASSTTGGAYDGPSSMRPRMYGSSDR
jgi:5,10-methylenetetrahydrofolate reductase